MGTSGPKVSSFMQSMLGVTWVSRVGSTKEPSSLRPPRTTLAPWETASEICSATCRAAPHLLSDLEKLRVSTPPPSPPHSPTHLVSGAAVDERPLGGGGLRAVAQPELRPHRLAQPIHKDVVDATLNQEAVGADARLGEEEEEERRRGEEEIRKEEEKKKELKKKRRRRKSSHMTSPPRPPVQSS